MSRIAIPHWNGRISPVFDVAGRVLIVDVEDGCERSRCDEVFESSDPYQRAERLIGTGAEVLICGAISSPLELALVDAGIEVIAQTCGGVESILFAYRHGRLRQDGYRMPGCRRRLRSGRTRRTSGQGPVGFCVCPRCGWRARHLPGQPCNRSVCPDCGTTVTRAE